MSTGTIQKNKKRMGTSLAQEEGTIVKKIICALAIFAAVGASSALATSYYVATYGNDSNLGTSTNASGAWATLAHAVSSVSGGDIIYVRGGRYPTSAKISISKMGTSNSLYCVTNYPGEIPILDFTTEPSGTDGMGLSGSYWKLVGLVFTNAGHNAIKMQGGTTTPGAASHNTFERCSFLNCRDAGIDIGSSSTATYLPGTNLFLNCDSWGNYDTGTHGGNADGFACKWNIGTGNAFIGCRAWQNSDDGWDLWMAINPVIISNCWTWQNGSNIWHDASFAGNGNGFKLGGNFVAANHRLAHSLAYQNVGNGGNGVDQNNNTGSLTVDNVTSWGNIKANFSLNHNSGTGNQSHLVRNNVSFLGGSSDGFTSNTITQNNSWNVISPTVNPSDFVSMDASQLVAPRQADGSLPDITLAHPVPGGRLVDKGVNLNGTYNGWVISNETYNGSAPDLGAYETAGGPPDALFTGAPTNGTAPLAVTFIDSSTGDISNRFWNFGDGVATNTSNSTMAHTYNAGTFTVTLMVSGSGGSDTNTKSSYITRARGRF